MQTETFNYNHSLFISSHIVPYLQNTDTNTRGIACLLGDGACTRGKASGSICLPKKHGISSLRGQKLQHCRVHSTPTRWTSSISLVVLVFYNPTSDVFWVDAKRERMKSQHSWLVMQSHTPSQAKTINSSFSSAHCPEQHMH